MTAAMAMASLIASKSPVAVTSTKHNLVYSRDHSVDEGLNYMVRISAEQYTGFVIIPQYFFPIPSNFLNTATDIVPYSSLRIFITILNKDEICVAI